MKNNCKISSFDSSEIISTQLFSLSREIVNNIVASPVYEQLESMLTGAKEFKEIRVMDKIMLLEDTTDFKDTDFRVAIKKQEGYMLESVNNVHELTEAIVHHIHLKKKYNQYLNRLRKEVQSIRGNI
ncbi:hypothetical protein D3C81_09020 [compost metagenome]